MIITETLVTVVDTRGHSWSESYRARQIIDALYRLRPIDEWTSLSDLLCDYNIFTDYIKRRVYNFYWKYFRYNGSTMCSELFPDANCYRIRLVPEEDKIYIEKLTVNYEDE